MKRYEVEFTRHTQHSVTISVLAEDEDSAETIARQKLYELDHTGGAEWEEGHQDIHCEGAEAVAKANR